VLGKPLRWRADVAASNAALGQDRLASWHGSNTPFLSAFANGDSTLKAGRPGAIHELRAHPAPDSYLDYLRVKLRQAAAALPANVQRSTFPDDG